jgi:hypothetical protein
MSLVCEEQRCVAISEHRQLRKGTAVLAVKTDTRLSVRLDRDPSAMVPILVEERASDLAVADFSDACQEFLSFPKKSSLTFS